MNIPTDADLDAGLCDPFVLSCPFCREQNLHQGTVKVFNRDEDCVSGAVVIEPGKGPVAGLPDENPSPRRQGLIIEFTCEHCNYPHNPAKPYALTIYQHKGTTYLSWLV